LGHLLRQLDLGKSLAVGLLELVFGGIVVALAENGGEFARSFGLRPFRLRGRKPLGAVCGFVQALSLGRNVASRMPAARKVLLLVGVGGAAGDAETGFSAAKFDGLGLFVG
jgi:hypothetical protein